MICTFYYKRLVLSYLQNSPANKLSLLSCFLDVLALIEIALINVSCIFCQHLSLLLIAKFSITSCLHFLIQECGPKVTYEINMPRARIFVYCTDDRDDEHCKPNRRPLSYGPPWAHYLGGYQDRLLGGPLGLPGLRYTAPEGLEHKDYTGVVLG
jgi:hypothetical protein